MSAVGRCQVARVCRHRSITRRHRRREFGAVRRLRLVEDRCQVVACLRAFGPAIGQEGRRLIPVMVMAACCRRTLVAGRSIRQAALPCRRSIIRRSIPAMGGQAGHQ